MKKLIRQSSFKDFQQKDTETLWHFADVGVRTCDMLIEKAITPDQFEKTMEVKDIYESIQREIEDANIKEKLGRGRQVKLEE